MQLILYLGLKIRGLFLINKGLSSSLAGYHPRLGISPGRWRSRVRVPLAPLINGFKYFQWIIDIEIECIGSYVYNTVEVTTRMPYRLSTILNKLDNLDNHSNALLIKEFYDYMDKNNLSENHKHTREKHR